MTIFLLAFIAFCVAKIARRVDPPKIEPPRSWQGQVGRGFLMAVGLIILAALTMLAIAITGAPNGA